MDDERAAGRPIIPPATAADRDAIAGLGHAAVEAGELPGIDHADIEAVRAALRRQPADALVAEVAGALVGYIWPSGNDLQVARTGRRRGIATALVEAALPRLVDWQEPYLPLHVPAGDTSGQRFAEARGFRYRATLHWMERPASDPCSPPEAPEGIELRSFDPRCDALAAYVTLMNEAFADHATPASWTEEGLAARHAEPDFDPADICLATQADRLMGFARATVEPRDDGPIGEIHLIGVRPAWRGRGLGRTLLRWSIRHLQERDVPLLGLSVVAVNEPALHLYEAHGFRTVLSWPQWSRES